MKTVTAIPSSARTVPIINSIGSFHATNSMAEPMTVRPENPRTWTRLTKSVLLRESWPTHSPHASIQSTVSCCAFGGVWSLRDIKRWAALPSPSGLEWPSTISRRILFPRHPRHSPSARQPSAACHRSPLRGRAILQVPRTHSRGFRRAFTVEDFGIYPPTRHLPDPVFVNRLGRRPARMPHG